MNVTFLTPRFHPEVGGAETWSRHILAAAVRSGDRIEVLTGFTGGPRRDEVDGVDVRRIGPARGDGVAGRARWYPGFMRAAVERLRESRPEAVVVHHSPLPATIAAARRLEIPSVAMIHDIWGFAQGMRARGALDGSMRALMLERSLRALPPDGFIVASHATAVRLGALARGRPVTVVPMGADHIPVGSSRLKRSTTSVAFVGRLVREKGVDDLITAIASLRTAGHDCEATIVGEGPHGAALRARGSEGVTFAGTVADAEVDATMRSALALVLPSSNEGWGLVITEAALRGTPYIAYDIPAVREQHDRLGGGLLTPPSPGALAAAIEQFLLVPKRARALGNAGRRAARTLTWDASWATAREAIERAIAGRRAPRGG